ncbi:MAG: RdgB/HAM1 family non-canonical purine NTP pyrophosphatase [Opitutaceae bacterium]|nr:RdgB/HAM1 family non-canonical purine NTP pyrophosphatase [Opitutaceae bacterium]
MENSLRCIHLATANAHKVAEFAAFARQAMPEVEFVAARRMPAVTEDTGTFTGNARKKVAALRAVLPERSWVLADDSGLCVAELGGEPGVESAYYAGPQGDSAANLKKLVAVMRDVPQLRRGAEFVCVLVLWDGAAGQEHVFEGRCRGCLRVEPVGGAGFGYDPLFVPDGFDRTYAELGDAIKNEISHRARALQALARWLKAKDAQP